MKQGIVSEQDLQVNTIEKIVLNWYFQWHEENKLEISFSAMSDIRNVSRLHWTLPESGNLYVLHLFLRKKSQIKFRFLYIRLID